MFQNYVPNLYDMFVVMISVCWVLNLYLKNRIVAINRLTGIKRLNVKCFAEMQSYDQNQIKQIYITPYIESESEALGLGLDRIGYVKQFSF